MEVEIYYEDLCEERKEEIRKLFGVETDAEVIGETNWDIIPLTSVFVKEED